MRLGALIVAVIVVVTVSGFAAAEPVAPADVHASISSVSVRPSPVPPDEYVTVRVTVRNLPTSRSNFGVNAVALRTPPADRFRELVRVESLGTVSPGASLSVPLRHRFGNPGVHRLRVWVYGEGANGRPVRLQYPVLIRVSDPRPTVDIAVDDPIAGRSTTATVTVGNGLHRSLRNLEVSLDGPGLTIQDARQVRSALSPTHDGVFAFTITAPTPGRYELAAIVNFSAGTTRRTVRETVDVTVDRAMDSVALDARVARHATTPTIIIDITNLGNVRLDDLVVRGTANGSMVSSRTIGRLGPHASRSIRLEVGDLEPGSTHIGISARYQVVGRPGRTVTNLTMDRIPALLTLTDVAVTLEEGLITLTGKVSNLGGESAAGVAVRLEDSSTVRPTAPDTMAFAGTVAANGAIPFDLSARVVANTTRLNLVISSLDDGRRVTRRDSVNLSGVDLSEPPSGTVGITGVDISRDGDRLVLSGTASNTGTSTVEAAILRVVSRAGVTPIHPNKAYFVGTIPPSDFVSFDLSASVDANVSAIPVQITYLEGGSRRERIVSIALDRRPPTPTQSSGTATIPVVVGVVLSAVIIGVMALGWRNSRAGP